MSRSFPLARVFSRTACGGALLGLVAIAGCRAHAPQLRQAGAPTSLAGQAGYCETRWSRFDEIGWTSFNYHDRYDGEQFEIEDIPVPVLELDGHGGALRDTSPPVSRSTVRVQHASAVQPANYEELPRSRAPSVVHPPRRSLSVRQTTEQGQFNYFDE